MFSGGLQRVELIVEHDGAEYRTAHLLRPLTDDEYAAYHDAVLSDDPERLRRVVDELHAAHVEGVEGFADDCDGDWRAALADEAFAPDRLAALAALDSFREEPPRPGDRLTWNRRTQRVRFQVYDNGRFVPVAHTLRAPTEAQRRRAEDAALRPGAGGVARLFGALYDEMHESHEGYVGGVPLAHKCLAVRLHLRMRVRAVAPGEGK